MGAKEADGSYDVIVVGVGGMGSAALYHLARRGLKVLGLEKFGIAHEWGSSHGLSRIIRLAYHEDPRYVPLLRRAYDLWEQLGDEAGTEVLHITGGLDIGPPDQPRVFNNALNTAKLHTLEHEVLTAEQVNERFPGYSLPPGYRAVYSPKGGIVAPERAIKAHVAGALAAGAQLRKREPLVSWQPTADGGVRVTTAKAQYTARRLVLTAGAWLPQLVPALQEVCVVERQVIAWFEVDEPERFARFPISIITDDLGEFYIFPPFDHAGLKIGKFNHLYEKAQPDALSREITAADERVLRGAVARHFPHANHEMSLAKACMFTNSTDHHFIIDRLPDAQQVVICSACSGHGFKFCSVIGEVLADLAADGATRHDIDMHRISPRRPGHAKLLAALNRSRM